MKTCILVFFSFFCSVLLHAQEKTAEFGKIDKADLALKDCEFDPGAEAEVLIDEGSVFFIYRASSAGGLQSEVSYRMRIKVFKNSALNRAQIRLRYQSKNHTEFLDNIAGISYNLDASGNIAATKLDKAAVYTKDLDKGYSEVSFALPDVKAGTVFEYRYKKTINYSYDIPVWFFQEDIPVKYSAYKVAAHQYFKYTTMAVARQPMETIIDKKSLVGGTTFIMRNVPGIQEEAFSSGVDRYKQKIDFQLANIDAYDYHREYTTTWPKLIDELLQEDDFGEAVKTNIKGTGSLNDDLKKTTVNKEKIRAVYNYVQTNMQWNGGYSRFTEDGVKAAWEKRTGSTADINFILIRLLRDAGINAFPLLASTKAHGPINNGHPFLDDFNCVLAYVKDGEEVYVMNAADKFNPFYLAPVDFLYTYGLVVDRTAGGLIPINNTNKFTSNISFTLRMGNDAKFEGEASLNNSGYARGSRLELYKNKKLTASLEENDGIDIKVDSISVSNEHNELLPFTQDIQFSGALQHGGDYVYLPYGVFAGMSKNPFIQEKRVMDIDFDYPKSYLIKGTYVLPDSFTVSSIPKNAGMALPDTSIVVSRGTQVEENIITFRLSVDFKAPGYTAESYPYIKDFFKKMYDLLNEKIILKKK